VRVCVQAEDFDVAVLQRELLQGTHEEGAIAGFTGYVRASNRGHALMAMELEHYPGMTERSIEDIVREAASRWPVLAVTVIHRIGSLQPGEKIVWVGVASGHRETAFSACEFIMDYLKTRAPFWKREIRQDGASWVEARASDEDRASRWAEDNRA
jgi:molybdopterin synthase catalytic subunit